MERFTHIKEQQYRVALNASEHISQTLLELSDIFRIDFSALAMESQLQRMENATEQVKFLAYYVETSDDFEKALRSAMIIFRGKSIRFIYVKIEY